MVKHALVTLSVVVSLCIALTGDESSALNTCSNTQIVGVRGSGQLYGESHELEAIKKLTPQGVNFSELDNNIPMLNDLPSYKAVPVTGSLLDAIENGGLAVMSRSAFGEYRKSVKTGKDLLEKYINSFQSTNTCLVLTGYSQGAQVVNETVREMHKTDPDSLKNVIYIGLLGDPLYSPFGFDSPNKPSWLRGSALYPFYGVLYKDIGLPGVDRPDYIPRNPSNPKAPFTKIGSWCNYGDVICATDVTHYAAMQDGHSTYIDDGIPEMVDEIKAAIANPDQNITNAIYPSSTCGAAKQDMVVLLDTSAYMRRNKDLFTNARNTWDTKLLPGTNQKIFRTFGEQMLDSGCGDKRVAVVGFEGSDNPRLLLNFTSNATDVDNLMNSLYAPSTGGVAVRPKLREAAILGMQQSWRADASRTLLALSPMAGSGVASATWRDNWSTPGVMEGYMNDAVGQQLLALSRQTRSAMITAPYMPIDMNGFTIPTEYPGTTDAYNYFQQMARLTGGYNWEKTFVNYSPVWTVKNVNFSAEISQFEVRRDGTKVGMTSVKAQVGKPVTLTLTDNANLLASARLRNNGTITDWYIDCDGLQKINTAQRLSDGGIVLTPTKAGDCMAAVRVAVQADGNGCYSGCPEPFPPYMLKVIPFKLEVKPAGYVEEKPGNITAMNKFIYDDHVEFTWLRPTYQSDDLAYLVKDSEGSVLGITTTEKAVVTDTDKQDADILVQAIGSGGRSDNFSSTSEDVGLTDSRTVEPVPEPELPPDPQLVDTDTELGDPLGMPTQSEEQSPPSQDLNNDAEKVVPPQLVTVADVVAHITGASSYVRESSGSVEDLESNTQILGDSVIRTSGQHAAPDDVVLGKNKDNWWWRLPIVIASVLVVLWARAAIVRR